jgi:Kef-type K+ transport system membrane component KefB
MNHHLESLGWTLVHFCWQAVAIALVYWLTDAVLSKARSQTRYVLALGTMLLMLVSALATFAYEETRGDSGLLSSAGAF